MNKGKTKPIPTFVEINDSHAAAGYAERTDLPSFHAFSLHEGCQTVKPVMPPHRRGFYQVALLQQAPGVSLRVDIHEETTQRDLLVFVAPEQVLSWVRSEAQRGFVIYFKPDFLGHASFQIECGFRFFEPGECNFLAVPESASDLLRSYCIQLCASFKSSQPYRIEVLRGLFTAFLFECLSLHSISSLHQAAAPGTGEAIVRRFRHLVNRNFVVHRKVGAYARLMRLTPGHLSDVIREHTGRSASTIIAERTLLEARLLLQHSGLSIADVSTHLQFSEPTHFTRFFKKASGETPRRFRESGHCLRD